MIYTEGEEYKLRFYQNSATGKKPVDDYLGKIGRKENAKISKYLEFLRLHNGQLSMPLGRHIRGKIWELRIDFSHKKYRLLYCIIDKRIIVLHVFLKKTAKTPIIEILIVQKHYKDVYNHKQIYE